MELRSRKHSSSAQASTSSRSVSSSSISPISQERSNHSSSSAGQASKQSQEHPQTNPLSTAAPNTTTGGKPSSRRSRKRKSPPATSDPNVEPDNQPSLKKSRQSPRKASTTRRSSRLQEDIEMSGERQNDEPSSNTETVSPTTPSRKKQSRSKKPAQQSSSRRRNSSNAESKSQESAAVGASGSGSSASTPQPRTTRKKSKAEVTDPDIQMSNTKNDKDDPISDPPGGDDDSVENDDEMDQDDNNEGKDDDEEMEQDGNEDSYDREADEEDEDAYDGEFGAHGGLSSTLRALSGMLSGVSGRLREILNNLRNKEDVTVQMIALQDLAEILLVSTEENLSGHFSTDQFVKELVSLMSEPDAYGNENPELMLLACRCIANLMEALPAATANVVYGGAVPVLCAKLLEIQYIDLAEQALSTLEKISVEYPTSIVREGGLSACLNFLDFFSTNVQRTAVLTAANCCRNIPADTFSTVRDVMPVLLNVLSSSDQKVVEQGCLCVARIVESFRHAPEKLEQLVSKDLLRSILQLLLPGTTNLVGPHIHTQFIRVLSIIARSSPNLSVEMFRMNITDTLYQILTGVSPPTDAEDAALKIDRVMIMQALIHRPREQVYETLNVVCELLPGLPSDEVFDIYSSPEPPVSGKSSKPTPNEQRIKLLEGCKPELKRFASILLPTLTDTFSSTVNLNVRQKVLNAQLKMITNLEEDILKESLTNVQFASYLASILSQRDHPTLVIGALQAAELLLRRLPKIYRYHFHREGVISEIEKLATTGEEPVKVEEEEVEEEEEEEGEEEEEQEQEQEQVEEEPVKEKGGRASGTAKTTNEAATAADNNDNESQASHDEDQESSTSSSRSSSASAPRPTLESIVMDNEQWITLRARKFMEIHEQDETGALKNDADDVLRDIKSLVSELESSSDYRNVFERLAPYFISNSALSSISSFELSHSKVVDGLLNALTHNDESKRTQIRREFLEVFMAKNSKSSDDESPFSVLVQKLQDLLSRSEHFEVHTVHSNSYDGSRNNAASMLAKQLRLKLVADDESDIPRPYRNIMVSIHAIATFKALDDYLRPRISASDQPRPRREPGGHLSNALAAFAAAAGLSPPSQTGTPATPPANPKNTTATATDSTASGVGSSTSATTAAEASTSTPSAAAEAPTTPSKPSRPARRRSSRSKKQHETATSSSSTAPTRTKKDRDSQKRRGTQDSNIDQSTDGASGEQNGDQEQLECMDERQMSEQEELEDMNTVLEDLDHDMPDSPPSDPGAVNMEVAATGKVTARKEDGTRVATPSNTPGNPARSAAASALAAAAAAAAAAATAAATSTSSTSTPSRPMSYAAAVATPQDWHIEFSIGDRTISNDTTIYGAVHQGKSDGSSDHHLQRSVWSSVYPIKFRRVPGPAPQEGALTPSMESSQVLSNSPLSLENNKTSGPILHLLSILHSLNSNLDDVFSGDYEGRKPHHPLALSQFVNTKLTAKLNRQLEEPLIVASSCLPSWTEDLARFYPFLFPFETRHLFLQSTSFGYSRSMTRWQNTQNSNDTRQDRRDDSRPFLGRLQRQKVRISRSRILESAIKVMELYGASPSVLEVEYFEEVGTGLGPTLEFYSSVSRAFSKRKLKMWRDHDSSADSEYAFGSQGLFPAPMDPATTETDHGRKVLHLFKILGKFVARSMLDSRIIDISFNPTFFRTRDRIEGVAPSLGAVKTVDKDLANSLKVLQKFAIAKQTIDEFEDLCEQEKQEQIANIRIDGAKIDDLGLDFTLPGYPDIELIENGSQTHVTIENVGKYVERVIDLTLGSGVAQQTEAFRAGFAQVFPYTALRAFTPAELVMLFGKVEEDWTLETLMDSVKADHGFNMDSKSVKNLLQVMSEFTLQERRDFLQFVTGSPKLPIGGFKNLTPMFTVVCKPSEPPLVSDDYLPSVMTCVNYLKLPDYTSLEVLRQRLQVAVKEGQGAFHLS